MISHRFSLCMCSSLIVFLFAKSLARIRIALFLPQFRCRSQCAQQTTSPIASNQSAMPALLSPSRLPLLSVAALARHRLLLRSPVTILRFRGPSSNAHLPGALVRSSSGWTNHFRALTPSPAVSRVYSMATPDAGPSIVVYVTVPNKETGTKLAHGIIENKLAACVNQIPGVESTYWWEGKVETDTEILLMIKTRQSLLGELTDHVKNNHPYDTPEVIALPITGGSEKYLKWIGDNTKNAEVA